MCVVHRNYTAEIDLILENAEVPSQTDILTSTWRNTRKCTAEIHHILGYANSEISLSDFQMTFFVSEYNFDHTTYISYALLCPIMIFGTHYVINYCCIETCCVKSRMLSSAHFIMRPRWAWSALARVTRVLSHGPVLAGHRRDGAGSEDIVTN